jgi:hypothetical protein
MFHVEFCASDGPRCYIKACRYVCACLSMNSRIYGSFSNWLQGCMYLCLVETMHLQTNSCNTCEANTVTSVYDISCEYDVYIWDFQLHLGRKFLCRNWNWPINLSWILWCLQMCLFFFLLGQDGTFCGTLIIISVVWLVY